MLEPGNNDELPPIPGKRYFTTAWGSTWDYVFYFELRGHASEPKLQDALKALEEYTVFVKVLGSWPLSTTE
jgi:prephenate dehydratase